LSQTLQLNRQRLELRGQEGVADYLSSFAALQTLHAQINSTEAWLKGPLELAQPSQAYRNAIVPEDPRQRRTEFPRRLRAAILAEGRPEYPAYQEAPRYQSAPTIAVLNINPLDNEVPAISSPATLAFSEKLDTLSGRYRRLCRLLLEESMKPENDRLVLDSLRLGELGFHDKYIEQWAKAEGLAEDVSAELKNLLRLRLHLIHSMLGARLQGRAGSLLNVRRTLEEQIGSTLFLPEKSGNALLKSKEIPITRYEIERTYLKIVELTDE
jgi:hypothetical protein